jgi:hypothetical protein
MKSPRLVILVALFLVVTAIEIALSYQYYWVSGTAAHGFLLLGFPFVILFCLLFLRGGYRKSGWGLFGAFFAVIILWQLPGFMELRRTQDDIAGLSMALRTFVEKEGRAPLTFQEVGYSFRYPDTSKKIQHYEATGKEFTLIYDAPHPSVGYVFSSKDGVRFIDD